MLGLPRKQVHNGAAPLGIAPGRHVTPGFVHEQIVQGGRRLDAPTIHANLVVKGVGLAAQRGDDDAIDADAALANQLLGCAPRRDACGGQHLLQTLHRHIVRCGGDYGQPAGADITGRERFPIRFPPGVVLRIKPISGPKTQRDVEVAVPAAPEFL